PTPWISEPRFETWLASQRARNVRLRKGASVVGTAMGLLRERGRTPPFSPAPPSAARGGEGAGPADRFLFLLASCPDPATPPSPSAFPQPCPSSDPRRRNARASVPSPPASARTKASSAPRRAP